MTLCASLLSRQEVRELRRRGVVLREPRPEVDAAELRQALLAKLDAELPALFARQQARALPA